jgi:CheY-like chemotaxis protein
MATRSKVLVIDDDSDFRTSLRALLEAHGYEVAEADSGHEAMRKIVESAPNIILLDVMMETSEEGYSITHALRHRDEYAAYRGIPIVMISSIEESPDERFPMAPEVEMIRPDRYMTKPLEIPRLLEVLKKTA